MTGGVQNFAATAAVPIRVGPDDLLLVDHDETIARASCTFD